jgi:hypothetical protein
MLMMKMMHEVDTLSELVEQMLLFRAYSIAHGWK